MRKSCRFISQAKGEKHSGSAFHPSDDDMWSGNPHKAKITKIMFALMRENALVYMLENKLKVIKNTI